MDIEAQSAPDEDVSAADPIPEVGEFLSPGLFTWILNYRC
jgi:hypothetical protein